MLVPARTRTRGRHAPRRVCPETSECGPRAGSRTRTREAALGRRPSRDESEPVLGREPVPGQSAPVMGRARRVANGRGLRREIVGSKPQILSVRYHTKSIKETTVQSQTSSVALRRLRRCETSPRAWSSMAGPHAAPAGAGRSGSATRDSVREGRTIKSRDP